MFIAAVYSLFGVNPLLAVFAQTFISAPICLFAYHLAKELGAEKRIQLVAALLAAVDPASISVGLTLVAETLSNFFVALSLIFLVRLLKSSCHARESGNPVGFGLLDSRLRGSDGVPPKGNSHENKLQGRPASQGLPLLDAAACAACVVLAALARPNAIYFFGVVALVILAFASRRLAKVGVFVCLFAIGVLPWYFRNYAYANTFTFATTSDFNLFFYKAVSVEQWATGKSPLRIEAEFAYQLEQRLGIARSFESYDENSIWPYLVPADTRAYRLMREMAWEVYLAHPLVYLFLIPVTLVKLLGLSGSLNALNVVTGATLVFNLALYTAALMGCLIVWQKKLWIWLFVTLVPIIYFLLVPAVTGGVQDTRARTSVTICFVILAAIGLGWLWEKLPGLAQTARKYRQI